MSSALIVAVTGLKREAKLLAGAGVRTIASGGDIHQLEATLEQAFDGALGVISIGLGGALATGLKPGDWVVGDAALDGEIRYPTDPEWTYRLVQRLPGARRGPVVGSDVMVADAAAKAALHATTGALAVDMESHIAARVAARQGLPFAVARTVSDGADRALPKAAQAGMKPDGGMDVWGVIRALARDPRELPALIRTGLEAETAFRALLRGRQLLGPTLGRSADFGELLVDVG